MKKMAGYIVVGGIALLLLIQLVPYGRAHENPRVLSEPTWDTPQTRELAQRACFDCHSNETVWPVYSNVAPVSWLIAHDVDEGRRKLNFSNWTGQRQDLREIQRSLSGGKMPPWYFVLLHPQAHLTEADKQALLDGLLITTGSH